MCVACAEMTASPGEATVRDRGPADGRAGFVPTHGSVRAYSKSTVQQTSSAVAFAQERASALLAPARHLLYSISETAAVIETLAAAWRAGTFSCPKPVSAINVPPNRSGTSSETRMRYCSIKGSANPPAEGPAVLLR